MGYNIRCEFDCLEGEILKKIHVSANKNRIDFICKSGNKYAMYHEQECSEDVYLESIDSPINSIYFSEIISAEKRVVELPSMTATFYIIFTEKGSCTFRWCGTSNGFYSEEVDFFKIID